MRLIITAGPTREPIDPVRFIGNRSSGRVGFALAADAAQRGHEVTLLLGPVMLPRDEVPAAVNVVAFETTQQLSDQLHQRFDRCDVLIMAAAVADYTPTVFHTGKLPRRADGSLTIELSPTADVVAGVAKTKRSNQRIIGFALEEESVLQDRARKKLERKGIDAIVANPLRTMDATDIQPTWLTADGAIEPAETMPKSAFAGWLLDRAERMLAPVESQ